MSVIGLFVLMFCCTSTAFQLRDVCSLQQIDLELKCQFKGEGTYLTTTLQNAHAVKRISFDRLQNSVIVGTGLTGLKRLEYVWSQFDHLNPCQHVLELQTRILVVIHETEQGVKNVTCSPTAATVTALVNKQTTSQHETTASQHETTTMMDATLKTKTNESTPNPQQPIQQTSSSTLITITLLIHVLAVIMFRRIQVYLRQAVRQRPAIVPQQAVRQRPAMVPQQAVRQRPAMVPQQAVRQRPAIVQQQHVVRRSPRVRRAPARFGFE